jgi:hypothetical protein
MPGQTIGTVNVQLGASQQTVRTLSYGITTLKGLVDVSMAGATDNDVVVYKAATNSFVIQPASAVVENVDGGTY